MNGVEFHKTLRHVFARTDLDPIEKMIVWAILDVGTDYTGYASLRWLSGRIGAPVSCIQRRLKSMVIRKVLETGNRAAKGAMTYTILEAYRAPPERSAPVCGALPRAERADVLSCGARGAPPSGTESLIPALLPPTKKEKPQSGDPHGPDLSIMEQTERAILQGLPHPMPDCEPTPLEAAMAAFAGGAERISGKLRKEAESNAARTGYGEQATIAALLWAKENRQPLQAAWSWMRKQTWRRVDSEAVAVPPSEEVTFY